MKNTFLRRAAKDAGLPDLGDLRGQTAIVVGDKDVAAAAKVLKNFTAEFKKPEVKTGVVDRLVVTGAQIQAIADLPSREVLLATLLGVLNAPASALVRVLNEPASALARVLQARVDQGGGVPAEAPAPEAPAAQVAEAPPQKPPRSRKRRPLLKPPLLRTLRPPRNQTNFRRRQPVETDGRHSWRSQSSTKTNKWFLVGPAAAGLNSPEASGGDDTDKKT